MKLRLITTASVIALSAVASAHSADIVVRHRPMPPVIVKPVKTFSFTGFYLGAQGAYRWGKQTLRLNTPSMISNDHNEDLKGASGGLYAGFNSNLESGALLGIETDFVWNKLKGKNSYQGTENNQVNTGLTEKWSGATRLRFGYAQDHILPYIAGGVAYARLDTDVNSRRGDNSDAILTSNFSDKTFVGWTAGAGVDYAATDNVIVRLEYRYSDYGKKSYQADAVDYNIKYRAHDVRVGVAYKF